MTKFNADKLGVKAMTSIIQSI